MSRCHHFLFYTMQSEFSIHIQVFIQWMQLMILLFLMISTYDNYDSVITDF